MAKESKKAAKPAKAAAPFQLTAVPPIAVWLLCWPLWLLDFLVWLLLVILPLPGYPIMSLIFCVKRCSGKYSADDPHDDENTAKRRDKSLWPASDGSTSESDSENPLIGGKGLMTAIPGDSDDEDAEDLDTVWALAQRSFNEFPKQKACGTREFLALDKSKPGPPRRVFGPTSWITYKELAQRAAHFGSALVWVGGLEPALPGSNLDAANHTMLIYEDTSAYWLTGLLGAHSQSIVVATSYATLGLQAVADAIKDCNVAVALCNRAHLQDPKAARIFSSASSLKVIVYTDHYVTAADQAVEPPRIPGIKCIAFEDFLKMGEKAQQAPTPPAPECLAVIMYTSGSTGKPKGVMITHGNVAASVAGLGVTLKLKRGGENVYVAHLPAAHIFEFCVEIYSVSVGAQIGFADPRTLSATGAIRQLKNGEMHEEPGYPDPPGAIQEYRPTILVAVPVIWDTMKKKIEEEVGKASFIPRSIFHAAFSAQRLALKQGRTCPLLNILFKKKFHAMMGGRFKFAASGGGPISAEVQEFISTCFGCSLRQGYALTETTMAGTCQWVDDPDTGNVGSPLGSVELKVRSCDGPEDPKDQEGHPYLDSDTDHYGTPCDGRGEILIRGPSVSMGYYKQPEKWAEVFDSDGWFYSGDIGYWDAKGRLVIVDRLKNLVKLKGGEYIALEHMEKEYGLSPFVDGIKGGIMCYGDGDMRRPGALVQVNLSELKKWARSQGIDDDDVEALCANEAAKKAVLESLIKAGKNVGANEKLVEIGLISGTGPIDEPTSNSPWTPENGCRTPSNKLDRKGIQKTFSALMDIIKAKGA